MKIKVTNKRIRDYYSDIIAIPYCDAQTLLSLVNPFAYNAGVYGWNCDFYEVENICISTGYRTIGRDIDMVLLREYEDKARRIRSECDWREGDVKINELLIELIQKLKS